MRLLAALLAPLAFLPSSAAAATLMAEMTLSFGPGPLGGGGWNVPRLALTNHSDVQITGFTLTIGDTRFNFDGGGLPDDYAAGRSSFFAEAPDGGTAAFAPGGGDSNHTGNGRAGRSWDALAYVLTGFDPGETFTFDVDVDPDTVGQTAARANTVMVNNGADVLNALLTVTFSDGSVLSGFFADGPAPGPFSARLFAAPALPVPAPPALALMPLGLLALRRVTRG